MSLSRLENFLQSVEGFILYVNPSDFDATDSIENRGNSLTRPFFSIQRALIEAARFSYQQGRNNDRNDRTTILVYPGTHYIDNRPGYSIQDVNGQAIYKRRTGKNSWDQNNLLPFSLTTNFDILDPDNDLHKYNSINGGVILPRGTSIIGLDLRKTKIRPLYVPNPENPDVDASTIFNVTGTCYFSTFTIFDADNSKTVFRDYTGSKHVPVYSHHKLTTFGYADGVNKVKLGLEQTDLTDLDMYYYKIARAYGDVTGRGLGEFPVNLDFEPSIDEYRIVGTLQPNPLAVSQIFAGNGDGTGDNSIITVTTADLQTKAEKEHGLFVDSPVLITGVTENPESYNGSFTVSEVVGLTTFRYRAFSTPTVFAPDASKYENANVIVESDTVSSASPYIFNCSLRSVFGMCGLHADGSKANGFKSIVVAQFTGVSLQKDSNAFMVYDNGIYYDNSTLPEGSPERPLHINSKSIYKPDYESFHIRASSSAFIQAVSVFAIGYSKHFLAESGGDMSVTNSNSNFGSVALESIGFRDESFDKDDVGYITHVIPPRELTSSENDVTWISLDIKKTIDTQDPSKLYIFGFTNKDIAPSAEVDGFRVGAKRNDKLYLTLNVMLDQFDYDADIYMDVPIGGGVSSKKEYQVSRNLGSNIISQNILTLDEPHRLFNGEKVRIFSDTGQAPDELEIDIVYYAITGESLSDNQIQLALTLNDAISRIPIIGINNNGGVLKIISTVSDKTPGDLGHPVQYDENQNNWYIKTSILPENNNIYFGLVGIGTSVIGVETPSTYIKRKLDSRSIEDKIYKIRYVISKEFVNARPPQAGFVLQESKNVGISSLTVTEGAVLTSPTELRNERVIVNADVGPILNNSQVVTITSEIPHGLSIGDIVKIDKIRSVNNSFGTGIVSTYNGVYKVEEVPSSRKFKYSLVGVSTNPGQFTSQINSRNTRQQRENLPVFSRNEYSTNYFIYRVNTIKRHIPGDDGQDGIYHLTVLSASVSPSPEVGFELFEKGFNQDVRNLYPQLDRDNYNSDPDGSISYADLKVLGRVITDDKKKSITKETLNKFIKNTKVGFAITGVELGIGNTSIIIFTDVEHSFNSIKNVTFLNNGSGYPISSSVYNASLLGDQLEYEDSTCRFVTNAIGEVNPNTFRIVNSGSSHFIGETLSIEGGVINAVVNVTEINSNIGDGLELSGFVSSDLNGIHEIIDIPNKKTIVISNTNTVSTYVENTNNDFPLCIISSKGVGITSIAFSDVSSGIVTVTTSSPHGLLAGNKFRIVNSGHEIYDSYFVVNQNIGISTFNFNVGILTEFKSTTVGRILKTSINSNATNLGRGEENLGSRSSYIYAGISDTLGANITTNSATITVSDPNSFTRGDYVVINSEVVRISSIASGNTFSVIRGQLGTNRVSVNSGTLIKKIKVVPMELRRPSFLRSSGHTFEYVGYGPGNYSTALPQKQDRVLSDDDILTSQAREQRGGTVVYTGMNDLGEFFTGSKKLSSATGEEVIIEAPIITFTGDDSEGEFANRITGIFDEVLVRGRITVEGGENNNQSSQFYGPVSITNKLTNLSDDGILTKNLYIRGNSSQDKLITVGIVTPTSATISSPNPGFISLLSNPLNNYIGHVYVNNEWRPWGPISLDPGNMSIGVDRLGVGVDPTSEFIFNVVGNSKVENLRVTGNVVFDQTQSLGSVIFEDIVVNRTGRFTGLGVDALTGLTTSYTQIHERGTSRLSQLENVGVATFFQDVYINQQLYVDRIELLELRLGITNLNRIDTKTMDLILGGTSGLTIIDDSLKVFGNFDTHNAVGAGIVTAYINESRNLKLGLGNTSNSSSIDLHNDDSIFSEYGLRIIRNSGIGSVTSEIIHRGISPMRLIAQDSADLQLLTNNVERIRVGFSGTITSYQTNSGTELKGAHVKINQNGPGDVALSWDITHNNANVRWYAGIDVDDEYSWKLANPFTTVIYGNENFISDYKLKVDSTGTLSVSNNLNVDGNIINATNTGTFTLLNTNITTLNAFNSATLISIGANTNTSRVSLRGTTQSTSTTTGALTVAGGVGIVGNLRVGGNLGNTVISGTLSVSDITTLSSNLTVGGNSTFTGVVQLTNTTQSTSTTTGALTVAGGVGIVGNLRVGGLLSVDGAISTPSNLSVSGTSTLSTVSISGGNINGTIIGGTTRAAANFTSIDVNANSTFNGVILNHLVLQRYGEIVVSLGNVSGTTALDLSNGNVFTVRVTGNTTFTFTNVLANVGSSFTLILTNGSGNLSVSWPSNVKFPNARSPIRTLTNGRTDIWIFITPDGGNTWYGNIALYNFL
jgi:hypothetical protein